MKVGDLVQFRYFNRYSNLNGKKAVYLGEDFIHRSDGVIIENHKILYIGASKPTIIDVGLIKHLEVIDENR